MPTAETTRPTTILLIHGMWMTGKSWQPWIRHYAQRGFDVLAPSWPGLDVGVEALRSDPTPLARLRTQQIVDHYHAIIRDLPNPPIIIGHSYGGAITQVLLDRGLGAAGIGLHAAFVKGVYTLPWRTVRSTWRIALNPLNAHRAPALTHGEFHHAFASSVDRLESDLIYAQQCVPTAGRAFFEGITANLHRHSALAVDPRNHTRAPLLLVGSEADNLLPFPMQRATHHFYRHSRAVTELVQMPGRSHDTLSQDGWETVADRVLAWALDRAGMTERVLVQPPTAFVAPVPPRPTMH